MGIEIHKGDTRARLTARFLARRLRIVGPVFGVVFLGVAASVWLLERAEPDSKLTSFTDALWFCLVTMSTVGYGDLFPVSGVGRAIAGVFILFTLGTVGLLITAVSEAVLEVKRMEESGLIGTRMTGHVIVCGFNPMARAAVVELLAAGRQVALLCETPAELELARDLRKRDDLFLTSGEPATDVLRDRLNAARAVAAVIAMRDDTRNLIAALNLKVVSPELRLVVALQREELRQTLLAGGVTYVASPNELSGRLVASAAFEPEVAQLLEDLMSGAVGTTDMQQVQSDGYIGRTVREIRAEMNELDGPLLVAIARRDGEAFRVLANPARDTRIETTDQLLVIANTEQMARLEHHVSLRRGR